MSLVPRLDSTLGGFMKTVAFLNKKGGVGKTSTTHHLGGELAARKYRVLLVDGDPQANLTQGLLGPTATRALPQNRTIAALFDEEGFASVDQIISESPIANISLMPGTVAMENLNSTYPERSGPLQLALRDALAEAESRFDYCLIDCPPNVQLCSWAALVASNGVVVPLQAEDYGSQGLVGIRESIRQVQKTLNPSLIETGYLITMYQKSLAIHLAYESDLRGIYGDLVFTSTVPIAKDFKEAVMKRMPVWNYKPKSAASKAIGILADEFLARIHSEANERRVA